MRKESTELTDHFLFVFQTVNSWLKFAEAKNGTILALTASALGGIIAMIEIGIFSSEILLGYVCLCALFLAASAVCSLVSFMPRTKVVEPTSTGALVDPNLVYYGHIAHMSAEEFMTRTCEDMGLNKQDVATKMNRHIAAQIVVNSQIALRKYSLSSYAISLAGIAVLSPLFLILLARWNWREHIDHRGPNPRKI